MILIGHYSCLVSCVCARWEGTTKEAHDQEEEGPSWEPRGIKGVGDKGGGGESATHLTHTHRNTHFVLATWDRDYKAEEGLMLAAWRVPPAVPAVWGIEGRVPQAGDTVAVSIVKRLERLSQDMRDSET